MKSTSVAFLFVCVLLAACAYELPDLAPEIIVQKSDSNFTNEGVTVTFLGNSTLVLDDAKTGIVIDGFVSRPRPLEMLKPIAPDTVAIGRIFSESEFPRIDVVVPLHSHYDHLLDAPYLARLRQAELIGSKTTGLIIEQLQNCPGIEDELFFEYVEDQKKADNGYHSFPNDAFSIGFEVGSHSKSRNLVQRSAPRGTFYRKKIDLNEVNFCEPVSARHYRQGESYNLYITHGSGIDAIEIAVLGGMVQKGFRKGVADPPHPLHEADIIFLPLPVLARGSDHTDFAKWLWDGLGRKKTRTHIIPVHWDYFLSPLDKHQCGNDEAACLGMLPQLIVVADGLDERLSDRIQLHWMTAFDKLNIRRAK